MRTELTQAPLAQIETELLAVFAADAQSSKEKDAKPQPALLAADEAVQAAAAAALASGEFKAAANETLLLHAPAGLKTKRLLVVGLGKQSKLKLEAVRNAAGVAVRFLKPRSLRALALALPVSKDLDLPAAARAAIEGAILGDFDSDAYRTDRKDQSIQSLTVAAPAAAEKAAVETALAEGVIVAESQNFARALVNEPGNYLTPTELGKRAKAMADELGLPCEVYSTDKIKELKMGAFLSVAQGSAEPPALIVVRYEPEGVDDGPVFGLVGKGITFDSGGISLKPGDGMEKMKYDMAGGAAMLAAIRALALLKVKTRAIAVICATENMPGGRAQKPGDVRTAMPCGDKPGKTIEVINTDAEGRLILADGVTYARQLGCTHLIDAATLTGACVVALGMINAGVFSNDDATYEKFAEGLKVSGEKFWRLPLSDEYAEMIKSDIADIKNTGGRWGGASTGAEFIHAFAEDTPWLHLDIAGISWLDTAKPYFAKGPTGLSVRSIIEWVRRY
jgi:leucyl aminopeptidase